MAGRSPRKVIMDHLKKAADTCDRQLAHLKAADDTAAGNHPDLEAMLPLLVTLTTGLKQALIEARAHI